MVCARVRRGVQRKEQVSCQTEFKLRGRVSFKCQVIIIMVVLEDNDNSKMSASSNSIKQQYLSPYVQPFPLEVSCVILYIFQIYFI